jgi:hypothetical protein
VPLNILVLQPSLFVRSTERERRKHDERERRHEEKKAEKQRAKEAKERVRAEREVDESDGGGVLDMLRWATLLAPDKRPTVQVSVVTNTYTRTV